MHANTIDRYKFILKDLNKYNIIDINTADKTTFDKLLNSFISIIFPNSFLIKNIITIWLASVATDEPTPPYIGMSTMLIITFNTAPTSEIFTID